MIMLLISISSFAQERKAKSNTYEQHRSAKTGRYVKKSETKKSPSTTYTTKRKKG
jgi:hypothetical protein